MNVKQVSNIIDLRVQNIREVEVGTRVISSKGFEFVLESRVEGKEAWLDVTSNILWFDLVTTGISHYDAMEKFNSGENSLPTMKDFEEAEEHGFREVLPNFQEYFFWSSSVHTAYPMYAYVLGGDNGGIGLINRSYYIIHSAVRCVVRR